MACGCNSKECIEALYNECAPYITLPIEAEESGTHIIVVEFNGVQQRREFEAADGQDFVVPNIFNGDYTHLVKIYSPGASSPNCYTLRTMPSVWHDPLPFPDPTPSGSSLYYYKIGDPAGDKLLPAGLYTRAYANGSSIDVPEIEGMRILLLRDGVTVEENETGYSRIDTLLTFADALFDCNITILLAGVYEVPPPSDDILTTNDGQPILTSDNLPILINA